MTLRSVRLLKFRFTLIKRCSIISTMKTLNISRSLNKHLPLQGSWVGSRSQFNATPMNTAIEYDEGWDD